MQDGRFNSRRGSDPGPNKMSVRASVFPPFMWLPHATVPVLVSVSAEMLALSAPEILENESEVVNIDPWFGQRRTMITGRSTFNGGLVRRIEG